VATSKYIREIGAVEDFDGIRVPVGVDYDTVTIGGPGYPGATRMQVPLHFNSKQLERFLELISEARAAAAVNAQTYASEHSA
jgi:hypothetical protein